MKKILSLQILATVCLMACASPSNQTTQPEELETEPVTKDLATNMGSLVLPEGFEVAVYAQVENARSMTLSPSGVLYVGNRAEDKVYAVVDKDGDGLAETKYVIDEDLNMPNGVAFRDGHLYVGATNQLLKYENVERDLANPQEPEVIYEDYPKDKHHGWKYMAFGPDGKLYVPVGAPCNVCESKKEIYATMTRINTDGTGLEIFAKGIRNTVGFDWHPETKELWFTDNGRDMLGDDIPPCELNRAAKAGMNFGYPYCHGGDIGDPEFGSKFSCSDFTAPAHKFGAHVAPLGMKFYTGEMFPEVYKGDIFVAQHGSWNRSKKVGYQVVRVVMDGSKVLKSEPFVQGWLDQEEQEAFGRPTDVLVMPDGALLVSDDKAGVIYRITYAKK